MKKISPILTGLFILTTLLAPAPSRADQATVTWGPATQLDINWWGQRWGITNPTSYSQNLAITSVEALIISYGYLTPTYDAPGADVYYPSPPYITGTVVNPSYLLFTGYLPYPIEQDFDVHYTGDLNKQVFEQEWFITMQNNYDEIDQWEWYGPHIQSWYLLSSTKGYDLPNPIDVPEPSTLLLLGPGLAGLWVWGRKKFKCI